MKSLIYYLLQVIITSGLLYGYYYFVLRNKKFHHYNRFYLLAAAFISILIPFLQIPVYFSEDSAPPAVLQSLNLITVNSYPDTATVFISSPKTNWLNWQNLSWSFYILISILFLLKIIFSLSKIRSIIRNNVIEKLDHINFVNTNEPETPFSFFRWMFWNRNIELSSEKGEQVFRHELFHIQQKHSWDIVFIELVTIVFWINPFFHLIKKELKAIHEFLADEFAVKENQEWKYAEFLLMQALNTQNSLINPFFHNQIKRRIAMITTSKKPSYQYLRKIMVLPIAAIVLGLFAFSYKQKKNEKTRERNIIQDTLKPKANMIVVDRVISAGRPFAKAIPTVEQLTNWQDSKVYGLWIDNKRISNEQLKNYKPTAFSHYFISKLAKTAINYGKHAYQVDLMTNKYYDDYLKKWDPDKKFTISGLVSRDTVPKIVKKYNGALILVDGKEVDSKELDVLDPNSIKSIRISKDKQVDKYGEKGKNGVIEIFTKEPKILHEEINIENVAKSANKISIEEAQRLLQQVFYSLRNSDVESFIKLWYLDNATDYNDKIFGRQQLVEEFEDLKKFMAKPLANSSPIARINIEEMSPFFKARYKIKAYFKIDDTLSLAYGFLVDYINGRWQFRWHGETTVAPHSDLDAKLENDAARSSQKIDQVWTDVEVEASFPGGDGALKKFLKTNMDESIAGKNGAAKDQYHVVMLQFIVDKDGNTSDWKALTNLGYGMEEEALRALKKTPKWIPARRDGQYVTAYRKQPVAFLVGENPYYIEISKQDLEKTTPFSLLKLQPGEEVVSFKMIIDAVGIKPQEFDLTGNYFSDEVKTRISTIQIETYIYLENIKVKSSNRIIAKPPMYGTVIPEQLKTNAFNPNDPGSWNFNDPEFKKKWHDMISEIKTIAWKEGKAAYEYKGRTYVFGKIKNPDPTVTAFTEQNGTGHVFLLNGELVTSIDELNKLITRSDVKKFGFISQQEASKRFNRDDAIVFIETYDSYLTKK